MLSPTNLFSIDGDDLRFFNLTLNQANSFSLISDTLNFVNLDSFKILESSPIFFNNEIQGLKQADFYAVFPSSESLSISTDYVVNKLLTTQNNLNLLHSLPADNSDHYTNLEAIKSQYHSSVPLRKLQYPEPYIASASFIHTDIGFIHILQYNYWLWFLFIWIIVFFFLTFLCTVRWCNMRVKPRRETRGVSRSKCGDLITACVPITWAISIIVTESTDASDFYDGFGAAEITIGIRAYQWGWEYYYPKNIDLNYNLQQSYSTFIGNSLKYTTSGLKTRSHTNLWKFYQNKVSDESLTPAHLLLLPLDNQNLLNFLDFNHVGSSTLKESMAFKKIKTISKTITSGLVYQPSSLSLKYKKINHNYLNDNSFLLTNHYGLIRQHNFLTTQSSLNNVTVLLDKPSYEHFLNQCLNTPVEATPRFNHLSDFTEAAKLDLSPKLNSVLTLDKLNFNQKSSLGLDFLWSNYSNTSAILNNNSDKSFLHYPLRKLFNEKYLKVFHLSTTSPNFFQTLEFSTPSNFSANSFFNNSKSWKYLTSSSSNQSVDSAEQGVRQYEKLEVNTPVFNFTNLKNTSFSDDEDCLSFYYYNIKTKGVNLSNFYKFISTRANLQTPYPPIFETNHLLKSLDYDLAGSFSEKTAPFNQNLKSDLYEKKRIQSNDFYLLQGKREGAPAFLNSSYWKTFWANSSPTLRSNSLLASLSGLKAASLPTLTNYYDYDFRNLQAFELLEDLFWENSYSAYNHDEYLTLASHSLKPKFLSVTTSLREPLYFIDNLPSATTASLTTPVASDISLTGSYYSNSIFSDDLTNKSLLVQENDFNLTSLTPSSFLLDDSYEAWNEARQLHTYNLFNFLLNPLTFFKPQSSFDILNSFRANFLDFSWTGINAWDVDKNLQDLYVNDKFSNFTFTYGLPNFTSYNSLDESQGDYRISNNLTLRSTVRNSIVNFNALQKVFRARFEDGRSNTGLSQLSALSSTQPFLNTSRAPYEQLLGKTKSSFFKSNFFNNNLVNNFNTTYALESSLNSQFFDFPFLLSAKSDMSRYMWFDWYAQWGLLEVGPSSSSRYTTAGLPYVKKLFSYNVGLGSSIDESETYLSRISRSRKNYIPNWTYTPYLYLRSSSWWNHGNVSWLQKSNLNYSSLRTLFLIFKQYKTTQYFNANLKSQFTPSISGTNTYTKSSWRPYTFTQAYHFNLTTLVDFLTKREYLYRQYLELNNRTIHLPDDLIANPRNRLLSEVRSAFAFNDPIAVASEYSREVYSTSLEIFKFLLIKDGLVFLNKTPFNLKTLDDNLFFYLFGLQNKTKTSHSFDLYKNPFRPARKGVNNMLRLHATGAVAMPVEVRLQILASSRDVIHSWSVPSAGVKIDCVPGFTSHKIMIFLMEGIYWGQCMEICGRYHHWMPIMVYFMRRDLFFLWCSHFIFNTSTSKTGNFNDRVHNDFVHTVSYESDLWLNETSSAL